MPRQSPAFTTGPGSLWSSAADLISWTRALHTGQVLNKQSYARLITDYGEGYGYGLSVFKRLDEPVFGHDGRIAGYASDAAYYPNAGLTVVVLSNVESVARDTVRVVAAAAALNHPYEPAMRPEPEAGPEHAAADVAGTYRFSPALVVRIYRKEGRLLAQAHEGGSSELVPLPDAVHSIPASPGSLSRGAWFSRMLYTTVCFEEHDKVMHVRWGCGALPPVARVIE